MTAAARNLLFRPAAALTVIAIIATWAACATTARAQQVDNSLTPHADLTIASHIPGLRPNGWHVTVKNNTVGVHPGIQFDLVKVKITLWDPVRGTSTQMWNIRNLPPGGSAVKGVPTLVNRPKATDEPEFVPQRLYAEIIKSDPVELPRFRFNDATENWVIENRHGGYAATGRTYYAVGDVVLDVAISDRLPQAGGATTFTVAAFNDPDRLPNLDIPSVDQHAGVFDIQIEISLSPGLSFATAQPSAPSGTTFDTSSRIWNVGTMVRRSTTGALSLPVDVNLTAPSLADLPLEERCLTAKVVRAVPWFGNDPLRRQNDTVTACLGAELLSSGMMDLIDFYPCVGATSYPCTSADTLELVITRSGGDINQPETVIVHVPDPGGRTTKSGSTIWSTVDLMDLRDSQTRLTADWEAKESVKVTAPGGGDAPGRWLLTNTDDSPGVNFDLLDATDSSTVDYEFYSLRDDIGTDPTDYYLDVKVDLWEMGTYEALFGISGRLSSITYADSGTYIFHVGPASDLEVRGAGANPEVATNQNAYTILAVNNGPDAAPAVRVDLTGIPEGAEAHPSQGSYAEGTCQGGLCEGVWTIGKLIPGYDHRPSVYAAEGAALTLIAASGSDPITAEIENTQDYCVRIKTSNIDHQNDLECGAGSVPTGYTEHTAAYYDHPTNNNRTTIAAHAGTGDVPAIAIRSVEAFGSAAIEITWAAITKFNGYRVPHYEVQRERDDNTWRTVSDNVAGTRYVDTDMQAGETHRYRVRAVNDRGQKGPWSQDPVRRPGAPKNFSAAVDVGNAKIGLSWSAPDPVTGVTVSGYDVEYSTDGGGAWSSLAAEQSALTFDHTGLTLTPGAVWQYRARTVGTGGGVKTKSDWTAASVTVPGPAAPGAPKDFAASGVSDAQANLEWDAPDTVAGVTVTGYDIDFSKDGGNDWNSLVEAQTATDTDFEHTDNTLGADAIRQYRARTVGTVSVGGEMVTVRSGWAFAAATRDYPTPGAPRNFVARATSQSLVNLSWSAPESVTGVTVTGYDIDFSTDGANWSSLEQGRTATTFPHTDNTLAAGVIRQYRARAVGTDANNAVFRSGWVFASAATEEVGAPQELDADPDGIGRIDLTWDLPGFGADRVTGYRIDYALGASDAWQTLEHGYRASPRRYEHTGLSPGQEYCYRVAATYAGGTSHFADRACATTEGAPTDRPGEPENLRIARIGSNYVTLEWDAPSVGGAVEYYEWRSNIHAPTEVSPRTDTSERVGGLTPGSSYDFQVRAGNGYGRGDWSQHILVELNRAGSVVKPSRTELEVDKGGSGSFNVRLTRSPQWPLMMYTHSIGPECLTDELAYQQGKIMLPDNLRPSKEFWEDGWWGPPGDRWAQSWRKGLDIRMDASGCQGGETTVVEYSLHSLPLSALEGFPMWDELGLNWDEWLEKWGIDPLDGISGPSVKVTVKDGD